MPYADLTAAEKRVVDALAARARKKIPRAFLDALERRVLVKPGRVDEYRSRLQSIGQKLSDPNEEIGGVRVRTIRMLVTENLPTEEQLWQALKDSI